MLLDRDDPARPFGRGDDRRHVERLDRRDVDDVGVDPVRRQQVCGVHDARGLAPGADQGHVAALADRHGLPELEPVVVTEEALRRITHQAHVAGPLVGGRPAQHLAGLHVVGGRDRDHPGHGPHDRHVVHDDVAHPRLAGEEPGVAGGDLHVESRLGDQDPDLVERADHGERDERADEGDQPHRGQARRHAEHVLLSDPHLEVAVRVGLLEDVGSRRGADVAVEHDDPRVVGRQLRDRLAEDLPHRSSHRQRHRGSPSPGVRGSPRSAMAVAYSSGLIARVCQ